MSLRRPAFVTALCLGLCACGPGTEEGTHSLHVRGSQLALAAIDRFQVAVSTQPVPVVCAQVEQQCFKESIFYSAKNLVPLEGPDGRSHPALLLQRRLDASGSQAISLKGLSPGRNYVVLVEALTGESPRRFLGSMCGIQAAVGAGTNSASFDPTLNLLNTPVACDAVLP